MSKSPNVARTIAKTTAARFAAMPGPTGVEGRGGHEVVDLANRSVVESNLKRDQARAKAKDLNDQAAAIEPVAAAHEAEVSKTMTQQIAALRGAIGALVVAGYCVQHIADKTIEGINADIPAVAGLLKTAAHDALKVGGDPVVALAKRLVDAQISLMVGQRTGAVPVEPEPAPPPVAEKSAADRVDELAREFRRADGGKHPLATFIAQENAMAKVFGQRQIDADHLGASDIDELLGAIDAGLSPENLTADGERSKREVAARSKLLNGARKQLLEMRAPLDAAKDLTPDPAAVEAGAQPATPPAKPKRVRKASGAKSSPQAAPSAPQPVAAPAASAPGKLPATARLVVQPGFETCPKRAGSQAGDRAVGKVVDGKPTGGYWDVYVKGGTVDEAMKAGATRADILWDVRKGFVKTVGA